MVSNNLVFYITAKLSPEEGKLFCISTVAFLAIEKSISHTEVQSSSAKGCHYFTILGKTTV
jgi:hypothetical protein